MKNQKAYELLLDSINVTVDSVEELQDKIESYGINEISINGVDYLWLIDEQGNEHQINIDTLEVEELENIANMSVEEFRDSEFVSIQDSSIVYNDGKVIVLVEFNPDNYNEDFEGQEVYSDFLLFEALQGDVIEAKKEW